MLYQWGPSTAPVSRPKRGYVAIGNVVRLPRRPWWRSRVAQVALDAAGWLLVAAVIFALVKAGVESWPS